MTTHGGRRIGAGRKVGTGAFKEATTTKRIPNSLIPKINAYLTEYKQVLIQSLPADAMHAVSNAPKLHIPLSLESVRAGFPSPAEQYITNYLDFNEFLVTNPAATIAVYAQGDSMTNAGIANGDLLVVNRALEPKHRDIVLAELDNEFTVKRMIQTDLGIELHPENGSGAYPIIRPSGNSVMNCVGIVTHIIKKAR